jgi:hypothetical protein
MKYIPNNSLLTEQNRILQLYLVSLLFKYYILRLIQQKQYKDFELTEKSNSCCYFKAQPSTRLWQTRCGHWTRRRWCFENQWTLNDFGIGIIAWGGSYLALGGAFAVGGMARSLLSSPHFYQYMTPTALGYTAGGLGTSSPNHIEWNEKSARAGAFLGFGLQAAALGILNAELIMGLLAQPAAQSALSYGELISFASFGGSLISNDKFSLAWGFSSIFYRGKNIPGVSIFQIPIPVVVDYLKFLQRSYNAML